MLMAERPRFVTISGLEHLKKQARERLRELQVRVPDAQLADAQHAIAREYGFASWPKLKAHIEALTSTGDAPQPMAGTPQPPVGHGRGIRIAEPPIRPVLRARKASPVLLAMGSQPVRKRDHRV